MKKQEIIVDNYSFEHLRKKNFLYVDKTEYFYRLVSGGTQCYFCSRPRRFGKSLAISILQAIFSGRKDLFEGLYISKQDYDWETYPVVHFDMARLSCRTGAELRKSILKRIDEIAAGYGVACSDLSPTDAFDSLISALKKKTGKNVVVLIDEYDHPLNENIDNSVEIDNIHRELSEFYKILKGQVENERFVFMTGVTKFSKMSIFSKLNNLVDITLHRDYACMFGYTQEELEGNFAPYIDDYIAEMDAAGNPVDRTGFIAEIKTWYNGFRFHPVAETVYNPVSVGQFFMNYCEFTNYWFATGTPSLLVNLAKKQRLTLGDINDASVSENSLNAFDIADFAKGTASKEKLIVLLLQTGYLTIKCRGNISRTNFYKLRYPNFEIRDSFEKILIGLYTGMENDSVFAYAEKVYYAVSDGNTKRIVEVVNNMLAQIPYGIQLKDEKYYQSLMYLFFNMCGMEISAESETSTGRIDAVMEAGNHIYIFELKLDKTAAKAIEQIENRKYFQPFIEKARDRNLTVHCVGMNFCTDNDVRGINDWAEISLS